METKRDGDGFGNRNGNGSETLGAAPAPRAQKCNTADSVVMKSTDERGQECAGGELWENMCELGMHEKACAD